jgi:hypothetical protein
MNPRKKSRLCAVPLTFAVLVCCLLFTGGHAAWAAPYVTPLGTPANVGEAGLRDTSHLLNNSQSRTVTSVTYSVNQRQSMQLQTSVSAPTNLKIIARTNDTVTLTWHEPAVATGMYGYQIYSNGVLLGTLGSEYSAVIVNDFMPNTVYSFVIKAVDAFGTESAPSNKVVILLNGSLRYNYDAAGRLQSITIQDTGQILQSYTYDDNGNLLNIIVP